APFLTAAPAKPSLHPFRLAMTIKTLLAAAAVRLPASFRHVRVAAAHRPSADLLTLPFPNFVVSMSGTDQRVGDLVQQRVVYFVQGIALDEVNRQLDGAALVEAHSHRAFASVEPERPAVQAVKGEQFQGEPADPFPQRF